jgi:hypothetical protein
MFRYPGDPVVLTAEQAAEILLRARLVVKEIAARLPVEAHPQRI